jgi:Methyltransferase FkbM domain
MFAGLHDPALAPFARLVLSLLRPMEPVGRLVRLGNDRDGGYVMLDEFADLRVAYSFGIGDNVSFDLALAEAGLDVFQYDHTVPGPPVAHERFRFRRVGLADHAREEPALRRLQDIVAENGHSGRADMLLKVDIEGAEWPMLASVPSEELLGFSQICLELHWFEHLAEPNYLCAVIQALGRLTCTHQVVHVHANNHRPVEIVGGVPIPGVIEATYVRRLDHRFAPTRKLFPTELDRPNDPTRPDIFLGALGML